MRIYPWILLVSPVLWGQAAPFDSAQTLENIRTKTIDTLLKQPDYTCTQTVDRTTEDLRGVVQVEDRLRLEVALVHGKEMFAWTGSQNFEDVEIPKLVHTGMFSNGSFGQYLQMLFYGGGPAFEYVGLQPVGGKNLLRYDFRVARANSRFELQAGKLDSAVGFRGAVFADPQTSEVRRLEIAVNDIPAGLGLTQVEAEVNYERFAFGADSFLLPVRSVSRSVGAKYAYRNRIAFSKCHRFLSESSLRFDDPETVAAEAATVTQEIVLPPGGELQLALIGSIDLANGVVGEPVEAKLNADAKVGKLIVPKGATATGRIVRMDRYTDHYALAIKFADLNWKGSHAPLNLVFDHVLLDEMKRDPQTGDILIPRKKSTVVTKLVTIWKVAK